jgi:hypothetical protein
MAWKYELIELLNHPGEQEVTINLYDGKTLVGRRNWHFRPKATAELIQAQCDTDGKAMVDTRAAVAAIPTDRDIALTTPDVVQWKARVLKKRDEMGNCEVYTALYQGTNFQTAVDIVPHTPDEVADFTAKMSQMAADIVKRRDVQKAPPTSVSAEAVK